MHIEYSILPVDKIEQDTRRSMYGLLLKYYDNVSFDGFIRDLNEKSDVILLRDTNGILYGFSTLMLLRSRIDDQNVGAIFSGDTIVDTRARSNLSLAEAWLDYSFSLAENFKDPLYWFLISKGYRTYRFLPIYFKEFYPDPFSSNPRLKRVVETFAKIKFGSRYNVQSGIVSFGLIQPKLRCAGDLPDANRMKNPYVSFFAQVNPGYDGGDELCCCAPVRIENMTNPGIRILKKIGKVD